MVHAVQLQVTTLTRGDRQLWRTAHGPTAKDDHRTAPMCSNHITAAGPDPTSTTSTKSTKTLNDLAATNYGPDGGLATENGDGSARTGPTDGPHSCTIGPGLADGVARGAIPHKPFAFQHA